MTPSHSQARPSSLDTRRRHRLRLLAVAIVLGVPALACATSASDSSAFHPGAGSGSGSSGGGQGSGSPAVLGDDGGGPMFGTDPDVKAARPMRCDDSGRCTCFNIASIGQPGHTGFQAGMGGSDNTNAFIAWLNTQSSAAVDQYATKPTLNAAFLNRYDVIIFQWLVDGVSGYNGSGYWTFGSDELSALKDWVNTGGGVITLSGYDASSQETGPINQVLKAMSDITYGTADVLGTVSTANYCLGESDPLGGWDGTTPIGKHISEVGAFHGRPVNPGPMATVDCKDGQYAYAAHESVGMGYVFAYTDEWVTYTSQWLGIDAGASCADASAATQYQVPQFWYNAISYVSQATKCKFTLNGPVIM